MSAIYRGLMATACLLLMLAAAVAAVRFPVLIGLVIAGWAWLGRRRWLGSGYSHGTARAMTVDEIRKNGLLSGDDGCGLIMGTSAYADPPSRWQAMRMLFNPLIGSATACKLMAAAFWGRTHGGIVRIRDHVHLLTVAPAGAGKSVAVLIVNLLSYRGSCVITDPSGELWRVTAWFREKVLGRRCYRIDPFGVAGPASEALCLNPLDFIDHTSLDFFDQVRDAAEPIVLRDDSHTPHFNDKACEFISTFIAYVCVCARERADRNLGFVLKQIASRESFAEGLNNLKQIPGFHGILESLGHQASWVQDRELGSVQSTVFRHLSWLLSPAVTDCLSHSTIEPAELLKGLRSGNVDLYIIIPHTRLTTLAGLQRLLLSTLIRQLAEGGDEEHEVLFLLDEIGHLGRIQAIEDAITLWRKAGLRMWLFVQSLDQLKKVYGERADTIIDNLGTQQFFGITSFPTAETISKKIGDYTQIVESINDNASRSSPTGPRGSEPSPGSHHRQRQHQVGAGKAV